MIIPKKVTEKSVTYQKNLLTLYQKTKKNGETSSMNLFIICFTSAALLYVLTLPFVGKRAKKAHTEETPIRVYSERFPWEEDRIAYNRKHGLPDDAI